MKRAQAATLALLAGCTGIPLDGFAHEEASAFCALALRCRGTAGMRLTADQCVAAVEALIEDGEMPALRGAIDAGRVTYHPDRAAACMEALADTDCSVFGVFGQGLFRSAAIGPCNDAFEGPLADGARCSVDAECPSASLCPSTRFRTGMFECGGSVCQHVPQLGEPCVVISPITQCDERRGLGCAPDRGVCVPIPSIVPPGVLGASCNTLQTSCGPNLLCDATAGMGLVCTPLRSDGTCRGDPDCPLGFFCDLSTSHCAPLVGEGAVCAPGQCAVGLVCVSSGFGSIPHCERIGRVGAPCSDFSGCFSGACAGGVCAAACP